MGEIERGIATAKREAFWNVYDNVPDEMLTEGCSYCTNGWAEGPGLVYRCDNCNPGQPGDPVHFSTEAVRDRADDEGFFARLAKLWRSI